MPRSLATTGGGVTRPAGARYVPVGSAAASTAGLAAWARWPHSPSYRVCDTGCVADTITFRPDEDAARALDVLTSDGTPVSTAVRAALVAAARERARAKLRSEAESLAADEQDRAEASQVLRDMETLRAW